MRKGVLVIRNPEVAKLFADETRRRILHLLRHNDMSISDLAKALDKNPSSIIHHINLLKEASLVEETREEKVRNMIQVYYGSKADKFIISYSLSEALSKEEDFSTWREDMFERMVDGLKDFGIEIPEDKKEIVKELVSICYDKERKAFEESVEKQRNPVSLENHIQRALVKILTQIKLSVDSEYAAAIEGLQRLTSRNLAV
jgi:DNA-binding transcriptional ArsR family regulator